MVRAGATDAERLEQLAEAAFFVGREHESDDAFARAAHEWAARGDHDRAALCAFWLGFGLLLRGETAQANGWIARGRRMVAEHAPACAAEGYLQVPEAMSALGAGKAGEAEDIYARVWAIAQRCGDAELAAIALLGQGEVALASGRVRDGLALLDEAMVAVTAGHEVSPMAAGILYCAVIDACVGVFDLGRAREWTAALDRWCDDQPGLVPYRGVCLVHRSQALQAQGYWADALVEAEHAESRLQEPPHPAVGVACYQRGELLRLRGEFERAEHAFQEANRFGREPLPGLPLLRLATGDVGSAVATMRRAMDERHTTARRLPILPAAVEVLLAAGDATGAAAATDELASAAAEGPSYLAAAACHASASVALATGDALDALENARAATARWWDLGLPYELARSRELVGRACAALGDLDAAAVELEQAASSFERLGAPVDAMRVEGLRFDQRAAPDAPDVPLTERECEVLRLVASGLTNRDVAGELFISEHTVARHLQNIFAKVGVTSRSAATAYAYEHELV